LSGRHTGWGRCASGNSPQKQNNELFDIMSPAHLRAETSRRFLSILRVESFFNKTLQPYIIVTTSKIFASTILGEKKDFFPPNIRSNTAATHTLARLHRARRVFSNRRIAWKNPWCAATVCRGEIVNDRSRFNSDRTSCARRCARARALQRRASLCNVRRPSTCLAKTEMRCRRCRAPSPVDEGIVRRR
jgi:hypothetical protein